VSIILYLIHVPKWMTPDDWHEWKCRRSEHGEVAKDYVGHYDDSTDPSFEGVEVWVKIKGSELVKKFKVKPEASIDYYAAEIEDATGDAT
jgi:hypothetical protein